MAELQASDLPNLDDLFNVRLQIGPYNLEDLYVRACWVSESKTSGFEILRSSATWELQISQLLYELKGHVA